MASAQQRNMVQSGQIASMDWIDPMTLYYPTCCLHHRDKPKLVAEGTRTHPIAGETCARGRAIKLSLQHMVMVTQVSARMC